MHFDVELREFPAKSVLDEENIQGSLLGPGTEVVEVPPEPADRHPRGPKNPSRRSVRGGSDPEFVERMEAFLERRRRYIEDIKRRRGEPAGGEDLPELEVLSVEYVDDPAQTERDVRELEELSLDPRDHKRFLAKFAQMQEKRRGRTILEEAMSGLGEEAPSDMGRLRSSVAIQQKMVQQLRKVVQFQTDKLDLLRDSLRMVGRGGPGRSPAEREELMRTVDNLRELYEMEVLRRRDLEDMVERYKTELLALRSGGGGVREAAPAQAQTAVEDELAACDEMVDCGMFDEACSHMERVCARNPTNPSARNALGVAFFRAGRPSDALDAFNRTVELDPRCVEGWVNRGYLLVDGGRTNEAAESFQNALMLDPSSQDAVDGLMECEMVRMEQA